MDKSYTIAEVADKLNLSPKTLRRWEDAGRFTPSRTLGSQRRYSLEDIQILDAIKHGTIPDQKDLLTVEQAAGMFGVTGSTVERWENEGKIHPLITSGNTYYPRSRLLTKMDELKQSLAADVAVEPLLPTPPIAVAPPERIEPTREPRVPVNAPKLRPLAVPQKTQPMPRVPQFGLDIPTLAANTLVTLLLLVGYYLVTKPTPQVAPVPESTGTVQGAATTVDPAVARLESMIDSAGNLSASAVTLSPAVAPATAPGALYFDAGSQSLKLYANGKWVDIGGTSTLVPQNTSLVSGTGTVVKGKDQAIVTDSSISRDTPISITFSRDYSPAKKYWLDLSQGSFTLHTDFPVAQDSTFTYLIMAPAPTASPSASPSASPVSVPSI